MAVPEKRRKTAPPEVFSWVKVVSKRNGENTEPCPDYFEEIGTVNRLNLDNFSDFLKEKDVVLVMYHDPCDRNCCLSKNHFSYASGCTQRENSAFAAVDCTREPALCDKLKVKPIPFFQLYSKGALAASITEYNSFVYTRMKDYVENCPVLPSSNSPEVACQKG